MHTNFGSANSKLARCRLPLSEVELHVVLIAVTLYRPAHPLLGITTTWNNAHPSTTSYRSCWLSVKQKPMGKKGHIRSNDVIDDSNNTTWNDNSVGLTAICPALTPRADKTRPYLGASNQTGQKCLLPLGGWLSRYTPLLLLARLLLHLYLYCVTWHLLANRCTKLLPTMPPLRRTISELGRTPRDLGMYEPTRHMLYWPIGATKLINHSVTAVVATETELALEARATCNCSLPVGP